METTDYDSRAYANKELLKEDLSIRVAETINSAGALYEALTFAEEIIEEVVPEFDIEAVEAEIVISKGIIKELLENKVREAKKRMSESERKVIRIIDPRPFKIFLVDFYKLFLESKDSVKKWKHKTTEQDIGNYFLACSSGGVDPRLALILFEDYMNTLANSGIIDFKTKTFKAGLTLGSGSQWQS